MRLCGPRILGYPDDRENALAVLRRALELGVTLVDTSDAYGPEVSELQIAEALHPYPAGLVIATKGGNTRRRTGQWIPDGRPEHLRAACEGSLKRLRLERIDLYQLHVVDPNVPIEDSVGELVRLRDEGKIRHIGVSNVDAGELERARAVAPVVSVQNRYSVAYRRDEDVLHACGRDGLAYLAWYPLDAGKLVAAGGPLERVALAHDATAAQVAVAWLLQRSPVAVAIPGTSSLAHLEENMGGGELRLEPDEVASLDG
jgi:aryl-alcohol dehydrogenase-like predicted oxidoreductase